jgi:hypothetical protein
MTMAMTMMWMTPRTFSFVLRITILQPTASVIQLPWYLQKDSNGRDVPTLLKLLAVKDKMIDALLREKTQSSSSSSSSTAATSASAAPPKLPSTFDAITQTLPPPRTLNSFTQRPISGSPNSTDALLQSVTCPFPYFEPKLTILCESDAHIQCCRSPVY